MTCSETCNLHTNLTGPKTNYICFFLKKDMHAKVGVFSFKLYRTISEKGAKKPLWFQCSNALLGILHSNKKKKHR